MLYFVAHCGLEYSWVALCGLVICKIVALYDIFSRSSIQINSFKESSLTTISWFYFPMCHKGSKYHRVHYHSSIKGALKLFTYIAHFLDSRIMQIRHLNCTTILYFVRDRDSFKKTHLQKEIPYEYILSFLKDSKEYSAINFGSLLLICLSKSSKIYSMKPVFILSNMKRLSFIPFWQIMKIINCF